MANRVPGVGPSEPTKPDQKVQREVTQRVEKVREVDPDEQARQQRFQQMMQPTTDEDEETIPLPSPFDLSAARGGSSSNLDEGSVPGPAYSKAPDVSDAEDLDQTLSDEDLPQSNEFWKKTDLPDQPIREPKYKEIPAKAEHSPFGPPGKTKTTGTESSPKKKKGGESEEESPTARYWTPEAELPSTRPGKIEGKENIPKERRGAPLKKEAPERTTEETPSQGFGIAFERAETKRDERERQDKERDQKKKGSIEIVSPTLPELPATVLPAAYAAASAASPYLRPETMPLFFQMVGSILLMSMPPGISRTEIVLNNPAFAKSKFFGATIEIIKYSTAPDSFNIRLTGSNEAVTAFSQNIPGLMAAFQTGHFAFRIGRIDAEYSTERPLIRRKESTEGGKQEKEK